MTLVQFFLAAGVGAAIALMVTFIVGLHRDGLLFSRRPSVPRASVIRRARADQKADLRRALKGSRTSWFTLVLVLLVVGACVDPPGGEPSCEEARADSFVMKPQFVCRIEAWPLGYTMYPLPDHDGTPGQPEGTSGVFLQPVGDGTGAYYAGPAQYNTVLKQPGVLASTPDGNCAWLPCHGGVPPLDAGVGE